MLTPNRLLCCCDVFQNVERISRVQCPVFILHGVADEKVHNIAQSAQLSKPMCALKRGPIRCERCSVAAAGVNLLGCLSAASPASLTLHLVTGGRSPRKGPF